MQSATEILSKIEAGDFRALARGLSLVENSHPIGKELLLSIRPNQVPIIGVTGPPGAGKSSLVNCLITNLVSLGKRVALIAVDPSSPFHYGALLGDRIRLSGLYENPSVFIRSVASRGALGGISDKMIELTDLCCAAQFDYVFVETVGVGQSEVEIAGLADTTIVVLVPEAGDDIQTMKAGLMEIADIFVVNKSDRSKADQFARFLKQLVHERPLSNWNTPIIQTSVPEERGITELLEQVVAHQQIQKDFTKKAQLLTIKSWKLLQQKAMLNYSQEEIFDAIKQALEQQSDFQLYQFLQGY
ncbi:methylmalonyl Co-A mutase-associated GTPase MeaB [Chitinophagales bacterium]|nr:methylmalonyl Co-A mutase-associated GTPase MeaB [Chitinophagales bacterium]